jgi:ribosomal protein S18 acetylase RimI-like enzyme
LIFSLDHPSAFQNKEMLRIFVDSFQGEPGFQYMFQNRDRLKQIAWSARLKYELVQPKLKTFVAENNGNIEGFSWWIPPDKSQFSSLWQQLKVGYAATPFRCGLNGFVRMYKFSNQERNLIQTYMQTPRWSLDSIAVNLDLSRKGLGGKLLQPGLELVKKSKSSCFVLTHNDRNVSFYEKYGFVLDKVELIKNTDIKAYCLLFN